MARKKLPSNQGLGDRTAPIPDKIRKVRGFGTLTIYQMRASPYWWARFYADKKIYRRSLKTEDEREAIKLAKIFFAELAYTRINSGPISKHSGFEVVARSLQEENERRAANREIAQRKIRDDLNRLQNDLLPYFGKFEVADITYKVLGGYHQHMLALGRNLGSNTLKIHYSQVRSILRHAQRLEVIKDLPPFPKQKTLDHPRPGFDLKEYGQLLRKAKAMVGQKIKYSAGATGKRTVTRYIYVTIETYDIIVFMLNTFIRPGDLKILQHKHISVVRGDDTYLRLAHPPTKSHSNPVVSMPRAVRMYERMVERTWPNGIPDPEAFVFKTAVKNRAYALRQMEHEFDEVLKAANLKVNAAGESRSLYSLRHTAIAFRILKSDGLGIETLARNARTSIEIIDRFYGSPLSNEMQVEKIQSFRRRSPSSAGVTTSASNASNSAPMQPPSNGGWSPGPCPTVQQDETDDWGVTN